MSKALAGRRLWSALWLVASPLLLWLYLQRVEVLRSGELRGALLSLRAAPLLLAVALHLLLVVSKGRRLSLLLRSARPGGAPPLRTAWLTGMYLGSYAMDYHLGTGKTPLTRVVEAWREHWPQAFPLPHPSPRNNRWLVRNPWFQQDVLPALQARVQAVLTANPKETP